MSEESTGAMPAALHPATREWFARSLGAPTPVQIGTWSALAAGEDALVIAPTGSGKTLAAFLRAIDGLLFPADDDADGMAARRAERTTVLYISPMKALGVDVEKNLRRPLEGIAARAAERGDAVRAVSVGVRSGDTTPAERRRLIAHPPDVLITTPESLFLMLTSAARETLSQVRTVIVDEVHAIAGSKRGVHLALSLARLDALVVGPRPQRLGLSATVEPPEEIARFLVPAGTSARIVAPAGTKRWDLGVTVPVPDMDEVTPPPDAVDDEAVDGALWPHVERAVLDAVERHRSTIVFCDSRRQAERLTDRLNHLHRRRTATDDARAAADDARAATDIARVHHGSMSKERRLETEALLKDGALRCVVATSTLELGIDMGAVDEVLQISSPFTIASLLQRVGRAGHGVGDVSRGRIHPLHPLDVVHAALMLREARAGRLEPLRIPANALDVLAQHTLSATALEDLDVEGWFALVRSTGPYRDLPRSGFDAVIDMLTGRYPSTSFADLRPRLVRDRARGEAGTLTARPGVQRLVVTNAGTIPDRGLFPVLLAAGEEQARRVGELDEEMVYETRRGDVITLGTSSWRVEEITHERVTVSPAPGFAGRIPFWHGDSASRPAELGRAIARHLDELSAQDPGERERGLVELGLDENARAQVHLLIERQTMATGVLPGAARLLVERFVDDLGDWRVVVHNPLGRRVNGPWALAIADRLREGMGAQVQVVASDDGIVLRVPQGGEAPDASLVLFAPEAIEDQVRHLVGASALFAARFRECSARALLLPRRIPTARAPLWQQRQRSATLLDAAREHPDFPMMLEAARECLQDEYDLAALSALMADLAADRIGVDVVDVDQPSPIARAVMFGFEGSFIYDGDAPLAERRTAALTLDQTVLQELLGTVSLRELLLPEAIARISADAQLLSPERRIRDAEDLADALRRLGPLTEGRIRARFAPLSAPTDASSGIPPADAAGAAIAALEDAGRAIRLRWHDEEHLALVEEAGLWRDAAGEQVLPPGAGGPGSPITAALLEPVDDAAVQVLARWARSRGPFTAEEPAAELPLPPSACRAALAELSARRILARGAFLPGRDQEEWVDAEVLRRIRRTSLAAARKDIAPVPAEDFVRFTLSWHGIDPRPVGGSPAGGSPVGPGRPAADDGSDLDALADVVDQLTGIEAPIGVWLQDLLPVRLGRAAPRLLEEALAREEILLTLHGAPGGALAGAPVRLHLADALALGLDAEELTGAAAALAPGSTAQAVLALLRESPGPVRPTDLAAALRGGGGGSGGGGQVSLAEVAEALSELALAGLASVDTAAVLLAPGAAAAGAPRRRASSRAGRGRRGAARLSAALLRADEQGTVSAAVAGPTANGRWRAVRVDPVDPAVRRAARVALMVDRHGLLTRGAVAAEGLAGGWSSVFRDLADLEDAGSVRRGYFVEGLGAAQFGQAAAVDRLRASGAEGTAGAGGAGGAGVPAAVVLSAVDPASPFGTILPWPAPATDEAPRPQRRTGAHTVISEDGRALAHLERGGRTLSWWAGSDASARTAAARTLAAAADDGRLGRVGIERIDGVPVTAPEREQPASVRGAVAALLEAGFARSPRSLRHHGR
ncbi:DEAD/DEAH box helicase [Brachybacterium sp. DNPG3]